MITTLFNKLFVIDLQNYSIKLVNKTINILSKLQIVISQIWIFDYTCYLNLSHHICSLQDGKLGNAGSLEKKLIMMMFLKNEKICKSDRDEILGEVRDIRVRVLSKNERNFFLEIGICQLCEVFFCYKVYMDQSIINTSLLFIVFV